MQNDFEISNGILEAYHGTEAQVVIPDNVTEIGRGAFKDCTSLISITIPNSVTRIGFYAFYGCTNLSSVIIPNSVVKIGEGAFISCSSLTSLIIPDSITEIEPFTFNGCTNLTSLIIPDSVQSFKTCALEGVPILTIVCREGSYTHHHCQEGNLTYIFDYQYEAFHGVLPPGIERLASPFLADEEKPYIFISYSHKDRDTILPIIKTLYESGWKVWYDEGLTIGDKYDETLEAHVKECSAFLLFVTEHSLDSLYVKENEIPWAIDSGRPVIKCLLDEGIDYDIQEGSVIATVSQSDIESALRKVNGLTKGESRIAKGISVVVNPADREGANGDSFAYCLYACENAAIAQAIMLEAKNSGCKIYDAIGLGESSDTLQNSACMIVFLDRAFLSNEHLTSLLTREYQSRKDIAVCQLDEIEDDDLPEELKELHMMQWLNFVYGITADMITKLARHLQKRGCRNTAILPGFEYEKTDKGIVIKRYYGRESNPRIEREYGGISVVEIDDFAFKSCYRLETITIPDGVTRIGDGAFQTCTNLVSVNIPNEVQIIGDAAFAWCSHLISVNIPNGVIEIGESAFNMCEGLTTVNIPDGVTEIRDYVFYGCKSLIAISIPESVTIIGVGVFDDCTSLKTVSIPDGVIKIGGYAFRGCTSLYSTSIPDSVIEINNDVFSDCPNLVITCSLDSTAWKYCKDNNIPVKTPTDVIHNDNEISDGFLKSGHNKTSRSGFFGRFFGRK